MCDGNEEGNLLPKKMKIQNSQMKVARITFSAAEKNEGDQKRNEAIGISLLVAFIHERI